MAELQFETVIKSRAEEVFNLIADLPNYGKWLPPSNLYGTVTQYTQPKVERGTVYIDHGKFTRMTGRVSEFQPPTHITFRQSTESVLGALDLEIRYILTAIGGYTTRVRREVDVQPSGAYGLIQGMLVGSIRKESERILAAMKAYLER
jgi:uncharacterized protein YndB with AHSA1/START domain